MKRRRRLHSCSAYLGFQAQQNLLEGGVEPPDASAVLDPATGVGEELESDLTDPTVVFITVAPGL
jgi:hypothetical protein